MDTSKLRKLQEMIYDMMLLDEKKHELQLKLLEALHVKDYKDKNPNAKSVVLATYFMSNLDTKKVEKHLTYECVDSKDHKRIDRLQKKYFSQYRKLTIKSYDLTKFIPNKTVATCQEQITKALN